MSEKNGTVSSNLPKMIVREKTEANTTIPPLPVMPDEYKHGGAWMDPQWKQDVNSAKKLFKKYPIQMGIMLGVTVLLAIIFGLTSGCGGSGESDASSQKGSSCAGCSSSKSGELLGTENAVSGSIGDCVISIDGYWITEDYDGVPSIVVQYEITNNGTEPTAFYYFNALAYQDDTSLEVSIAKTDEFDNQALILDIQPGGSNTVCCIYNLANETSPVEVVVSDFVGLSEEYVYTVFNIAGGGKDDSGNENTGNFSVSETVGPFFIGVVDYELFVDSYGDNDILVKFSITNNGDAAASAYDALFFYASQGDYELRDDTSYFTEENQSVNTPIQPGQTAEVSVIFSGVDFEGEYVYVLVLYSETEYLEFTCDMYDF